MAVEQASAFPGRISKGIPKQGLTFGRFSLCMSVVFIDCCLDFCIHKYCYLVIVIFRFASTGQVTGLEDRLRSDL